MRCAWYGRCTCAWLPVTVAALALEAAAPRHLRDGRCALGLDGRCPHLGDDVPSAGGLGWPWDEAAACLLPAAPRAPR
eukprot:11188322-Lingulodinium_polyedra.AAC.1